MPVNSGSSNHKGIKSGSHTFGLIWTKSTENYWKTMSKNWHRPSLMRQSPNLTTTNAKRDTFMQPTNT
jgi:hypothetical protein